MSGQEPMRGTTEDWERGAYAARWTPATERIVPPARQGPAPRATVMPWSRSRGESVYFGADEEGARWRCPKRECRANAGPYPNARDAMEEGREHERNAHPREQEPRTRTRGRTR